MHMFDQSLIMHRLSAHAILGKPLHVVRVLNVQHSALSAQTVEVCSI
jgi:hypothetical protein